MLNQSIMLSIYLSLFPKSILYRSEWEEYIQKYIFILKITKIYNSVDILYIEFKGDIVILMPEQTFKQTDMNFIFPLGSFVSPANELDIVLGPVQIICQS